jgi:DNA-binding IclR family transcriptional regulator
VTGESVLRRALQVLACFDADHVTLSLAELTERAGLPQSTAYRHVLDLVAWGALTRVPGGYQVGERLAELARCRPSHQSLRELARPHLEDLFEAGRHHVQLAVRDGADAVYVDFLPARNTVAVRTRVGGRLPLAATGVGLVLLAFLPEREIDEVLARPVATFTPKTLVSPYEIRRLLGEVRRSGVAISDGQITADAYSVAAPVRDRHGAVVAAVSVVVPANLPHRGTWIQAVRRAARAVSRELAEHSTDQPYSR